MSQPGTMSPRPRNIRTFSRMKKATKLAISVVIVALCLLAPLSADEQCYTGMCRSGCLLTLVPDLSATTVTSYPDGSAVVFTATIYRDSCTGALVYFWAPTAVVCPETERAPCQAHDAFPSIVPTLS